jgi:NlpC/P60 family putative phage cell wall peptidase
MLMTEVEEARVGAIVGVARSWLGTPYHHQASVKGAGADCLGLVRGVYREVMGREPETAPAYSRDWGETNARETLLEAAARNLIAVAQAEARPGDVVVFRLRPGTIAKHAAILATSGSMIHAMEGTAASEVALSAWWRRRIAGVFRFPL